MGKAPIKFTIGQAQGHCRTCKNKFVGPGDRCQSCQQKLRERKRRKPR